MKTFTRNLLTSTLICFALSSTNAQFVTIPDAGFRSWLNVNGYASCMNGNQMDTTCSAVVNATSVYISVILISNLTGISYFDNLATLSINQSGLTLLPRLPGTLSILSCVNNNLTSLPALPSSLQQIDCRSNQLTSLPTLPSTLHSLSCNENNLTALPALPASLTYLSCSNNNLSSLPTLPAPLQYLFCVSNQLQSLPALPSSLQRIDCFNNQITLLPILPVALKTLNCFSNSLTTIPTLPNTINYLSCGDNLITALPALPASLFDLRIINAHITSLPSLPAGLTFLNCSGNPSISLPGLPNSLISFYCDSNQLTALPSLPASLQTISCINNQLTALPSLPDTLNNLYISNNPGLNCLPTIYKIRNIFQWSNTGITCLPNPVLVGSATPSIAGLTICTAPTAPGSISVTGGSTKVCPGDTRTYSTPLVAGVTYNWTVPTGAVINSGQGTRTINVTYNSGFTSNGVMSVSKVQGCVVSAPKTLNINRNVPATPSLIAGTTYGLCGATNKTYSVTPVAGMTYQWTLPPVANIVSRQGTNTIIVNFPSTNFTGTVSVRAVNACGPSNARNLTVRAIPSTPLSITGPATACANQTGVAYSTTPIATAASYTWGVPSGAAITSGQGTTSIVMKYGTAGGNVKVRVVNACGNSSYRDLAVVINCREGMTGIDNDQDIFIYPNPSSKDITIEWQSNSSETTTLEIMDLTGRTINKEVVNTNETNLHSMDISALQNGVYLLRISNNKQTAVFKVVKE